MEVNFRLHSPAVLFAEKEFRYRSDNGVGGSQCEYVSGREEEIFCTCRESNSYSLARRLSSCTDRFSVCHS